jgi:hemophore-related protein
MVKLSSAKLVVAVGGLALSLVTGIGVASADPDLSPLINTTCSYSQAVAALNAQSPAAAQAFSGSVMAQAWLSSFLASSPDQRQRMLQALQGSRTAQQYIGPAMQAANTCNNY